MEKLWLAYKPWIIGGLGCLLALIVFVYHNHSATEKKQTAERVADVFTKKTSESTSSSAAAPNSAVSDPPKTVLVVDVKGAVVHPGIYRLQTGDRVADAIAEAGGFTQKADEDQINMALKVEDEMAIFIPKKGQKTQPQLSSGTPSGESAVASGGAASGSGEAAAPININEADAAGLQNLPGIGPAKAQAIIQYRTAHGPFKTVDDLNNVSGIGDKTLERIKPQAAVN
ncbi:MAG: helix-hairpin-helix domain-containing protein [Sporolactobacillus sp.]